MTNSPHLFSVTQHRFMLIHFEYRYMYATCIGLDLGHPQPCQYKNLTKGDRIRI